MVDLPFAAYFVDSEIRWVVAICLGFMVGVVVADAAVLDICCVVDAVGVLG